VSLLENTQLRRKADRTANIKLLSSEEKLIEQQLQNYSTQKGNERSANS
jgi:hypothetical protein